MYSNHQLLPQFMTKTNRNIPSVSEPVLWFHVSSVFTCDMMSCYVCHTKGFLYMWVFSAENIPLLQLTGSDDTWTDDVIACLFMPPVLSNDSCHSHSLCSWCCCVLRLWPWTDTWAPAGTAGSSSRLTATANCVMCSSPTSSPRGWEEPMSPATASTQVTCIRMR